MIKFQKLRNSIKARYKSVHERYNYKNSIRRNLIKLKYFGIKLGHLRQHSPKSMLLPSGYRLEPPYDGNLKISIVTPSFEQCDYIEHTIKSILDQRYKNLEYFIQDGGSTDGTKRILNKYSNMLSSVESKKDQGQANALNLGFSKSSGEIMAWLNSDDLLLPGSLNYVANFFENNPDVDVVYGDRILINESDKEIGKWVLPRKHDEVVLSWADYIPQETVFWRRRIWEKAGGYIDESFHFAMDWDLLLRFQKVGAKIIHVSRFLGAFRIHTVQKSIAQMPTLGASELARIRIQEHGRLPSEEEIDAVVYPFLKKHRLTHYLQKIIDVIR